jgi:hypothetical protein
MKYFNKIFRKSLAIDKNKRVRVSKKLYKIIFFLTGIASVVWFLIRVIPKPSRASYPCQRAAFPLASTFVIWIVVNILSFIGIKRLASITMKKRSLITIITLVFLSAFYVIWTTLYPSGNAYASNKTSTELFVPTDSANHPIGIARGIFPGRVVWAFDTTFSKWTVTKGMWWDSLYLDQAVVSDMVARSIHQISGIENDTLAWDAIFKYFNNQHGKGNVGYTAGEKIVIKLSLVQTNSPGNNGDNANFTPPQTVLALLRQLVYNAGVDADNIAFYDAMRSIPTSVTSRCKKEFPKVHFVGSRTGTNQEAVKRSTTSIHWSDSLKLEINGGNTAYLPTIITEASYMINLANLKGHHLAGITCCTKNHNGSFLSDGDSNTPHAIGMHAYFAVHDYIIGPSATGSGSPEWSFKGRDMGTYNCFVDVMGYKELGEKTLLFMIDGLYSVATEGISNSKALKWQQTPFNNHFSSSIFMSQDNVAIESVALDFFRTEQEINSNLTFVWEDGSGNHNVVYGNVDNYLHEAALADNPPSGTKYAPNGDSVRLKSLGVHEHWNNEIDKQYSRNLGKNEGIELVKVSPSLQVPSNLSLSFTADNTIKLAWKNDITDGKIIIFKSVGSKTNYRAVAQVNGDVASYTDNDLANNVTNYYRLKRVTDASFSIFSNEVESTPATVVPEVINYTFDIYPNPANNFINLKFNYPSSEMTAVAIVDLTGKLIQSCNFQNSGTPISRILDISKLRNGVYTVELTIGNTKMSKMLMVQ